MPTQKRADPAEKRSDPVAFFPARDRRWHRTRSAIIDAGEALFASQAPEGVTIDDIVAAADIAKGSFYNHFDGKEGLATVIVEAVQGDCEKQIDAANATIDDPAVRIARALCVMLRYAAAHPERLQTLINLSVRSTNRSAPLNAGVTADVTAGLERARFVGIDLEAGLLIVLGMIRITVAHAIISVAHSPATDLAATMGAAILRALGIEDDEAQSLASAASRDLLG